MAYPLLSFLELPSLSKLLEATLKGGRIDRIFIPECAEHPRGFFKHEWVLETRNSQVLISLRPQACGVAVFPPKTFRASRQATRSGFDLSLSKELEGKSFTSITTLEGERLLKFDFGKETSLYLYLIPAKPKGELNPKKEPATREISEALLKTIPNRPDLTSTLEHYSSLWIDSRKEEAHQLRKQKLLTELESQNASLKKKLRSLEEQLGQCQKEPDWKRYALLLQTHLYLNPIPEKGFYKVPGETGAEVMIPAEKKLSLHQQIEKFYHQAKRNRKKSEDSQNRLTAIREKLSSLEKTLEKVKKGEITSDFQKVFQEPALSKKISGYSGRIYESKEGLIILSGRSRDENLELTFKVAKGNDLWLHVKGRPGSHTVILLPSGRTASLETLLDAANLCLLHSGGKDWGKTEVDYTQRKHVKKIKGQSEVSYSGNKTLVVSVDPERIQRLYGEESAKS